MFLEDLDNKMSSSIEHLEKELQTIRTSRASPTMIENIFVDAYGSKTPLNQLGNISSPDSSMLTIQVWDVSLIKTIENSILESIWYSIYEILNVITTGFGVLDRSIFPLGGIEGYDEIRIMYLIPFILGIFMLLRLVPKVGWLARWAIAYIVGMTAGLRFYSFLNSDILIQIQASAIDFTSDWGSIINGLIVFIGTFTGLIYFFFSKEHKGSIGFLSKIGIYFLMIKFGASFGFAVMGRISLLIGRVNELKDYSSAQYNYATPIIMLFFIVCLGVWSFMDKKRKSESVV